LHFIKHIIAKYTAFLWSILLPLGIWGPFAIAAIDSAFFGLPLDVVVATYVHKYNSASPGDFPFGLIALTVISASAGSSIGSLLFFWLGYRGGEAYLIKRIGEAKFQRLHAYFERHEFLTVMVPSMLPPPTPFKAFIIAAGVAEMNVWHFLGAIFAGRVLRFSLMAYLTVKFGPQVINFILHGHTGTKLGIVAALIAGGVVYWLWRRRSARIANVERVPSATASLTDHRS
jgi:membrane protein YqaA with SNARE-associated domain